MQGSSAALDDFLHAHTLLSQGKKRHFSWDLECYLLKQLSTSWSLSKNQPNSSAHTPLPQQASVPTPYCLPSSLTSLLRPGLVYPAKFSEWSISVEHLPLFSFFFPAHYKLNVWQHCWVFFQAELAWPFTKFESANQWLRGPDFASINYSPVLVGIAAICLC